MISLVRALPNTPPMIRSSAIKQTLFITRRHASSFKFTSNIPAKSSKATNLPPVWSSKLFELPKPRPIDRQRYESTAGVVESGVLVLAIALFGTMYEKGKDEPMKVEFDGVESVEDRNVHDWIRPFDCYIIEEGDATAPVQAVVEEVIVEEPVDKSGPPFKPLFRFWS